MKELRERAADLLSKLSVTLYKELGPASSWAGLADGNAGAIRELETLYPGWLLGRAWDWTMFARETDADLALLAKEAADAIGELAASMDDFGTLFFVRGSPYEFGKGAHIAYHAGFEVEEIAAKRNL